MTQVTRQKWVWLKKPVPKWVALASGNMVQDLRIPSSLILSHSKMSGLEVWGPKPHIALKEPAPGFPPVNAMSCPTRCRRCRQEPGPSPPGKNQDQSCFFWGGLKGSQKENNHVWGHTQTMFHWLHLCLLFLVTCFHVLLFGVVLFISWRCFRRGTRYQSYRQA